MKSKDISHLLSEGVAYASIIGFPQYIIGSNGTVISEKTGRQLAHVFDQDGYHKVNLSIGGKLKQRSVHSLVLTAFAGPRNGMPEARHLNGNIDDNSLTNLAWGTREENSQDKILHGTSLEGDRGPGAKLTWEIVKEIRSQQRSFSEIRQIAKRLGVNLRTVWNISTGRTWKERANA